MKGHVPTPPALVDRMVARLFRGRSPEPDNLLLDPGCGDGAFLAGVLRYCRRRGVEPPRMIGVELNPVLVEEARESVGESGAEVLLHDFLTADLPEADYIVGNPPYVSLASLSPAERNTYRGLYPSATGRFDLYMLFMHRSLDLLGDGGRLVLVTPEKYQYVGAATKLREHLTAFRVASLDFEDPDVFPGRVTYPVVTTVEKSPPAQTSVLRSGRLLHRVRLPADGSSWSATVRSGPTEPGNPKLGDVCKRVSCGVATGCDSVFVMPRTKLPPYLEPYAIPTVSGRQLNGAIESKDVLLCPYDREGRLRSEDELGKLRGYLRVGQNGTRLQKRSCVSSGRKAWYAYHDSFPAADLRRPKILCKDICPEPKFLLDEDGSVVPRHSVYYIVPKPGVPLRALCGYLNSAEARAWLVAHSQRAAQGYYRMQSNVLRNLPVPAGLAAKIETPPADQ